MPKKNGLQDAVTDFRNIREKYESSGNPNEILISRLIEWERILLTEFFETTVKEPKKERIKKTKPHGSRNPVTDPPIQ